MHIFTNFYLDYSINPVCGKESDWEAILSSADIMIKKKTTKSNLSQKLTPRKAANHKTQQVPE